MKRLDLDQAVVISAYTGIACCNFADLHPEIEKRLGRPVFAHELASKKSLENEIKPAFKDDFLSLCYLGPALGQPEPEGPTDEELEAFAEPFMEVTDDGFTGVIYDEVAYARAILSRWGRPAIEPVPQQEAE